ncbi:hypothetical protein RND71_003969 [Anisodus tanguticus]|uniref:LNS2/PITP domain-containing protein n=1 Tax=Anisodus tanguticus TaxID=243964 RepID=A0AAE1SXS0_9SOLA|nr:hypothetical protein RND71_003969 [Anisodus tanguticus]
MYLDNSGEAYFIREVAADNELEANEDSRDSAKKEVNTSDLNNVNNKENKGDSDSDTRSYEYLDEQSSLEDSIAAEFGSSGYESMDNAEEALESQDSSSEVVMVSVDGHLLKAPILASERNVEDVKLETPSYQASPKVAPADACHVKSNTVEHQTDISEVDGQFPVNLDVKNQENGNVEVTSCAEEIQSGQHEPDECTQRENVKRLVEAFLKGVEISLCGNLLHAGIGSGNAREAFNANRISKEEFRKSIIKNENLVVRIRGNYLLWDRTAPIILGMAECDMELPVEYDDDIPVKREETSKPGEDDSGISSVPSGRRWTLWPNPFRRPIEQTVITQGSKESPQEQFVRTNSPTSGQITSLNLKEGQNMVTFIFSTRVLGDQKVESHIYLWKWNTKIVISDVDGTITKSDVLGQFMPLVGKDWTHFGTARLFSAIKENGYQLLFLSARAIVQAYLTKNFLFNLKQISLSHNSHNLPFLFIAYTFSLSYYSLFSPGVCPLFYLEEEESLRGLLMIFVVQLYVLPRDGKTLPTGPVVISPDGLFPSLYREVIRRAPHEFKIACLEDIKALFPHDHNPFYAGFGNRDTDEFSYRKIGIPKGKIFIINPKVGNPSHMLCCQLQDLSI